MGQKILIMKYHFVYIYLCDSNFYIKFPYKKSDYHKVDV